MNTGFLASDGWVTWDRVAELLGVDRCLWTDLGGLHAGVPAPSVLPVGATHLWAWRPGRWTRVRFDGDRALATTLTSGGPGEPVHYSPARGVAWGSLERAAECPYMVDLAKTQGRAPITFVTECTRT